MEFGSEGSDQVLKVMRNSRAGSTVKSYLRVIGKFLEWCRKSGVILQLPFETPVVALYLLSLQQQFTSSSSLVLVRSALKWLHSFVPDNKPNPLTNDFCYNIVEASKRIRSEPIVKKKPLTSELIKDIIEKFGGDNSSVKDLRIATLCVLGFAGFFRYNELSNILPVHIQFEDEFIKILIPRSKTDVYREGNLVYIRRLRNQFCPVGLLEKYMKAANIDRESTLPLFRPLTFHKSSSKYSLRNGTLSYSRCREIFKLTPSQLGYNEKEYGLHSLRSGGITSVVRNSNNTVPERLLKLHGRWKTDQAKDMYVEESNLKRLEVTDYLGLRD